MYLCISYNFFTVYMFTNTYYIVPQFNVIKMTLFHVYLAITVTNLSFITLYALFKPIMIARWPKMFYVKSATRI